MKMRFLCLQSLTYALTSLLKACICSSTHTPVTETDWLRLQRHVTKFTFPFRHCSHSAGNRLSAALQSVLNRLCPKIVDCQSEGNHLSSKAIVSRVIAANKDKFTAQMALRIWFTSISHEVLLISKAFHQRTLVPSVKSIFHF